MGNKQKILIINTSSFGLNGISSVIMNYYLAMNKENLEFCFIVNREIDNKFKELIENNNSRIYILNRNKKTASYFKSLYRIIQKEKFDFVHVHGNSSTMILETLAAKKAGIKRIAVHSHSTKCTHEFIHKSLSPFFSKTYNYAFACGKEAGKWLFGNKEFTILKNGIDLQKFSFNEKIRNAIRKEYGLDNCFVIGNVAVFNSSKNHLFLLEFFSVFSREIKNARLMLIGDGKLRKQIEDKIISLNIKEKVLLLGKKDNVFEYLNAMDVFVLPSLYEGFPVTLVEAQANGLPSIVTNNIDSNVRLSEEIEFCDISSVNKWVSLLKNYQFLHSKNRNDLSEKNKKQITKSGFNISDSAEVLRKIYEGE